MVQAVTPTTTARQARTTSRLILGIFGLIIISNQTAGEMPGTALADCTTPRPGRGHQASLVISATAHGGYLCSREHGMVIVPPHVQVVIVPLVLCSQAVSIRSATGCQ
jgi:hypothetical protein